MTDEVEATAAAPGNGLCALGFIEIHGVELRRDDGQGWVERGDRHDALLR
jgi:hypothetical protein